MGDHQIFTKCAWRLIPFMMLLFVFNFLDRVNVGFAALTMNKDLGLSPADFGFGAGIFFISYMVCQIPANAVLGRIGARRWIFCIMATWGTISAANAFVHGPISFYILRFLLGVAEAGFFPGMIFYLTLWFPQAYRARFTASFIAAAPLAAMIGGPLSGIILSMDAVAGLRGWQWLFLLEGLPAFLLSFAVLRLLPNGPAEATWLDAAEKRTIAAQIESGAPSGNPSFFGALADARVWMLTVASFAGGSALYANALWLPQIVHGLGFSNIGTGNVVALVYAATLVATVAWGFSSDRNDERIWHTNIPWLAAAAAYLIASASSGSMVMLAALTVAVIGAQAVMAPEYALPTTFLRGPRCGAAIALMNMGSSLGGFVAPTMIGILRERSSNYSTAMAVLAVGLIAAATIVFMLVRLLPRPAVARSAATAA